jgi:hypothetical protein
MSGMFVIYSSRPQRQLVQRRNGYREHAVTPGWAYVRDEANSTDLGQRADGGIKLQPRFIEDARSTHADPEASVTFLELTHRQSEEDAVAAGLRLPLRRDGGAWLPVNTERRPVGGL